MEPYHIYEFYEFEFSKNDISTVPNHRLGFLVASGLAANDQILFLNLYVLSAHVPTKDDIVSSISAMNSTIYSRNLISKTYEYMVLFDKFHERVQEANDKIFMSFAKMAHKKIKALRRSPVWGTIKNVRNKMTHHYDLDHIDAIKTTKDFRDGHRFKAFIHQRSRTSFYNYAEEIGYLSNVYETEEEGVTHQQILQWVLDCSRELLSLHEKYLKKFHAIEMPHREVRFKRLYVPDKFVWGLDTKIPLLYSEY